MRPPAHATSLCALVVSFSADTATCNTLTQLPTLLRSIYHCISLFLLHTLPSFSQLNATLQPPHCFDANMLKMLPTELIAFGKLQPASALPPAAAAAAARSGSSAAAQLSSSRQMQLQAAGNEKDVLHIGINGLHRWTPQFENHIWKHLGEFPPTPGTVATLNRYCASHFRQLIAFCSCPATLSDKSAVQPALNPSLQ